MAATDVKSSGRGNQQLCRIIPGSIRAVADSGYPDPCRRTPSARIIQQPVTASLQASRRNSQPCITSVRTGLREFREFGKQTTVFSERFGGDEVPVFVNEFWTSKQRAAHSLHEVSYRACFKPQLPRFFIERLTRPGDLVYDPFMGRGTTLIEAALLDRVPCGCDVNPLSRLLCSPRLQPPQTADVAHRMQRIPMVPKGPVREDLLVFYHPETLAGITALREYLLEREQDGGLDEVDQWIRMVATNRLTGHSSGFFSVYTLPPNQAVSVESQIKINQKRCQTPPLRDVTAIIVKKTRTLLNKLVPLMDASLWQRGREARLVTAAADHTPELPDGVMQLVVTSPPFLDVVNYKLDNWLRCWFNGIDATTVEVWQMSKPAQWQAAMQRVFVELHRVLRPGGFVAFEVGEVRGGSVQLEDLVIPAARAVGLVPEAVLINDQKFTKTSNCWGVDNLTKGTNTNRVVLLSKPEVGESVNRLGRAEIPVRPTMQS